MRREYVDNTVDGIRCAVRMECREYEVSGFSSRNRGLDGFQVSHLTDENNIGVFTESCSKCSGVCLGIITDLSLVNNRLLVAMQVLNRILNRYDVLRVSFVNHIDEGRKRCRLTGTGSSRNENQPSLSGTEFLNRSRKSEFSRSRNLERQESHYHRKRAALLKYVYTETSASVKGICEVNLTRLIHDFHKTVIVREERNNKFLDNLRRKLLGVERSQVAVNSEYYRSS